MSANFYGSYHKVNFRKVFQWVKINLGILNLWQSMISTKSFRSTQCLCLQHFRRKMEKQQIREQKLDAKPHLICSLSSSFFVATYQEEKKKKPAEKFLTVSDRLTVSLIPHSHFPLKKEKEQLGGKTKVYWICGNLEIYSQLRYFTHTIYYTVIFEKDKSNRLIQGGHW